MNEINDAYIASVLQNALDLLRQAKPPERGEAARRYAVTITEFEKVAAYFKVYVVGN